MQCPIDQTELKMADRQGVEIDYCPTCRGVWLDRGELDKIIERQAASTEAPFLRGEPSYTMGDRTRPSGRYRDDDDDNDDNDDNDEYRRRSGRQRRGWLGELFDFS